MSTRGSTLAVTNLVWIKVRTLLWKMKRADSEELSCDCSCRGERITHCLLSWWSRIFLLNKRKWTFSSPDQFSSSTAGPSLAAWAPGCLSRSSRGTSRTTSDTKFCAQWLISPKTTLVKDQENSEDAKCKPFGSVHLIRSSCSLLCVWEQSGRFLQASVVHCCLGGQQETQLGPAFHPEVNTKFPGDGEN